MSRWSEIYSNYSRLDHYGFHFGFFLMCFMFWSLLWRGNPLICLFRIFWGPRAYLFWSTLWRKIIIKRKRHLTSSTWGKSSCFSWSNGKFVTVSNEGHNCSIQWWRRSWPIMFWEAQLPISIGDQKIWSEESVKKPSSWLVTLAVWYSLMICSLVRNKGGHVLPQSFKF